jgi:hypothetical protein
MGPATLPGQHAPSPHLLVARRRRPQVLHLRPHALELRQHNGGVAAGPVARPQRLPAGRGAGDVAPELLDPPL